MGHSFRWAILGGVFCMSAMGACSDGSVVRGDPTYGGTTAQGGEGTGNTGEGGDATGGTPEVPDGKGVGEKCSTSAPCRDGLSCNSKNVCEPSGDKQPGDACVLGAECSAGQCVARECVAAGEAAAGEACETDASCVAGLRCDLVGLNQACVAEGASDLGGDCERSVDCFGGLVCIADVCAVPPGGGAGVPIYGTPWAGVECDAPVKGDVKAYFEVPGADGAEEGDFFRLPFPTDVRRSGGKLDLSGFPTPGSKLLGIDPVQLYVDAVSEHDSAWGAYPTVLFRFSGPFDGSQADAADLDTFATNAVHFIDVTDPAKGRNVGWQRFYTSARTAYVCDNWVAVQPPTGSPLEPGHTYAVFIVGQTVEGQDTPDDPQDDVTYTLAGLDDGKPVVRSDNMAAVMAAEAPVDAKLAAAHASFAPLRAYLAAKDLDPDNVLTASVFTVGEVRAPMTEIAAAVAAAPAPAATDWVKCGGAEPSPCAQAEGDRACGDDPDGYDEYHALLSIPVFQQGTAPYLTVADGGEVDTTKPKTEEVCLSMTVPEGDPPAAGWPTVIFAHGTGGSFRSHVRDEVAGVLAAADPQFAVIGIDQVEHGPRRGDSTESPNNLFFNFLNPAVTRGNPLQGAADQLSVARFAKALNANAATTHGAAIKVDPAKLFFFGHSQGSTEGSLALPFGDDYKAAVLSGNGASLRDALRTKTRPENIAAALPIALQDPLMRDAGIGRAVTAFHPVLSLLQQWIDPADPLNYAAVIGAPLPSHSGKHVFQTFGVEDSYSPPITMATFALAGGLTQVEPHSSADPAYEDDFPRDKNDMMKVVPVGYKAPGSGITLGMRQYGSPDTDGHFVVFDVQAANDDMVLFLTGATGATPPVIGK
jgi:hypothetical protein